MNSLREIEQTRWFRSEPVLPGFAAENIDADAGVIRDVVMVEEGPARGHGVHLDGEFVEALVAYDQERFGRTGLKARFGHPSASSETMGTQMGVFSNFRKRRREGRMQAIADLTLLDSAEASPTHPGMKSWVLSMAAERPDFIMSSIVFRGSGLYQRKPNGHKRRVEMDDDIDAALPVFIEFDAEQGADHFYTDLVEQGAATTNLFSNKINPDFFVSRAHEWLDENPDIRDFVKQNPQRVQFFLHRLGISIQQPLQKKMSKFSMWKWLSGQEQDAEPTTDDLDALKTELSAAKEAVTGLQTEKDALDNAVKNLSAQVDTLQANLAALKTEAEALKADAEAKAAEITELKKQPGDTHTGGDTPPAENQFADKPYLKNPVYLRAKKIAAGAA